MIARVLVPVDFSKSSLQALDYAIELAAVFKAEVIVLYVVEPVYYAAPDLTGGAATMAELFEQQQRQARTQLVRLEQRYRKARVPLRGVLKPGTAYHAIAEAAQELKADLIVMGTHGRTGVSHLLMGSVAERVVRSAPCPVLTVNASKQRRRLAAAAPKRGTRARRAATARATSARK